MPHRDEHHSAAPSSLAQKPIKPVGAWVVGGVLLAVVIAAWLLVALIFSARS